MPTPAPRLAIELWKRKEIDGTALMRRLIGHAKWSLPISQKAAADTLASNTLERVMINKTPAGLSRLYLYSGAEARDAFCSAAGKNALAGQHFIDSPGAWVFGLPLDGVDELVIDPCSPWEVIYDKSQFERLRRCAQAVAVEESLSALRAGKAPKGALWQVRTYHGYSFVLVKNGEKLFPGLAPDSKGRSLMAVFTFDDAAQAYLAEAGPNYRNCELLERTLSGTELFRFLSSLKTDGIVFNCCGPVEPVAFAMQFASIVCEATQDS